MIDYEKLKEAQEICSKLDDYYFTIDFCVNTKSSKHDISLTYANDGIPRALNTLDELIEKLKELTKREPKYQIGDKVFYIYSRAYTTLIPDIYEGDVLDVGAFDGGGFYCLVHNLQVDECSLYPTKQALIEAQINHWQNLPSQEPEQHVSDYCMPKFEGEIKGFKEEISDLTLTPFHNWKCPDCGHRMADYSGKRDDGTWWTGCSKRCGYYTQIYSAPDIQINQVKDDIDRCQHESDGMIYASNPPQYKCIKCGEFYK